MVAPTEFLGVTQAFNSLLKTPTNLTGKQYECTARIHLGFQVVLIFGSVAVRPSVKQIVAYVGYYVDKAKKMGS